MFNGILITSCGDRWLLVYSSDHFIRYLNAEPLCCTSERNIILHTNCTEKK